MLDKWGSFSVMVHSYCSMINDHTAKIQHSHHHPCKLCTSLLPSTDGFLPSSSWLLEKKHNNISMHKELSYITAINKVTLHLLFRPVSDSPAVFSLARRQISLAFLAEREKGTWPLEYTPYYLRNGYRGYPKNWEVIRNDVITYCRSGKDTTIFCPIT